MSLETTAWIVSLAGAAAFVIGGFVVGRAGRGRVLAMAGVADMAGGHTGGGARSPTTALGNLLGTTRAPPRERDGTYREDRLMEALARLDPNDGSIDQIVLVDEQGLPCAATDDALDAEQLAAVGAHALGLIVRVGETVARSRAVAIDLDDGRVLDVRPFAVGDATFYAVSVGARRVDGARFDAVAEDLRRILGP